MVTTVSSHGRVNGCFHNTLRVTQHKSPASRRGFFRAEDLVERLGNEAGKYYHAINHGFLADDRDQMANAMARPELSGRVC
jgi:predicted amidophosphoribosyltransferase